jgi:cytochrome c oxidase subunit 2
VPVHLYERLFLYLTIFTQVLFVAAILAATLAFGIQLTKPVGRVDPAKLAEHELFSKPGVYELAPGEYRAVVIGQVWSFTPNVIEVPEGAKVTFVTTSRDVLHGFKILGTNVNVMLIPGHASEFHQTFHEPGEYLIVCHEYCGAGHQAMFGKIVVTPRSDKVPAPGVAF